MSIGQYQSNTLEGSGSTVGTVSTTETTLGSTVLQAQGMSGVGASIQVVAWGTVANNANTKTLTFYFGGTSQAFVLQASTANSWFLEAWVVSTGTKTQTAVVTVRCGLVAASTTDVFTLSPTENDLANITVKVTGTATTTNDIQAKGFYVFV